MERCYSKLLLLFCFVLFFEKKELKRINQEKKKEKKKKKKRKRKRKRKRKKKKRKEKKKETLR